MATEFPGFDWEFFYFKYAYNSMHVSFIILSVVSYSYIFYKIRAKTQHIRNLQYY